MAKVLVIDDNAEMRRFLREVLDQAGHATVEAGNGVEGLKVFQRSMPDVVVTDIVMPEKDGLETIRELRRSRSPVKILAFSGVMRAALYLDLAAKTGAHGILMMPFSKDEFLRRFNQVLALV